MIHCVTAWYNTQTNHRDNCRRMSFNFPRSLLFYPVALNVTESTTMITVSIVYTKETVSDGL